MGMFDGITEAVTNTSTRVNEAVNGSVIGRYFEMKERNTNFTTEMRGATATFMSMAYILAVNPRILADSGGPCVPDGDGIFGPAYEACIEAIRREYVTSTAIASMVGCILMGVMANLPIALAPGMGLNAYFTYSVVGFRGTSDVSYKAAVTAVLIEGAIFLVLALTGARYAIIRLIPEPVKAATPAAIGAFLAHLGLQTAEGIGAVVSDIATAVTLGGCPESKRTPIVALTADCAANSGFCVVSDAYTCDDLGGVMTSGTVWLGILGLMIMSIMLAYRQKSAFFVGILFITALSWFRNTSVTYFPDNALGDARFEYFKKVVNIEPLDQLVAPYTNDMNDVGVALFTFLYVDFLDTSGTLMGLVSAMGYIDEEGNFPNSRAAFSADALATMFGSIFGLSPVTAYIESGSGVEAGSRTGLTAVICGFYFFLSIFFAPIISSIPAWATGGALIIVGSIMARSLTRVKWHDPTHALSAFLTVIVMPLTYSIAYGLLAGIGSYFISWVVFTLLSYVGIPKPVWTDADIQGGPVPVVVVEAEAEETDDSKEEELDKGEAVEGEFDGDDTEDAEKVDTSE